MDLGAGYRTVFHLPRKERRQHERFPQVFDVHARCLTPQSTKQDSPKEFYGRIPPRLEIPQGARDSHFPTAPATAG